MSKRFLLSYLGLAVMVFGVGVGVIATSSKFGLFDTRNRAGGGEASTLSFVTGDGRNQYKVGDYFNIDVILDTTNDPYYTVSAVDAAIGILGDTASPAAVLTEITAGNIFENYPRLYVAPGSSDITPRCQPVPPCLYTVPRCLIPILPIFCPSSVLDRANMNISGVKNYAVDSRNIFQGYSGRGRFATLTFKATKVGRLELKHHWYDPTSTLDSNISGFRNDTPISLLSPEERFKFATANIVVDIVAVIPTPTPTPIPTPTQVVTITPYPPSITPVPLNPISWSTDTVSLQADDFWIADLDKTKYYARATNLIVRSDPGNLKYTTLEATWYENGKEMRLYMYFHSDGLYWWSPEFRTYNGVIPSDWIYYTGMFFNTKLGQTFMGDFTMPSPVINGKFGSVYFKNLRLKAFKNNTAQLIFNYHLDLSGRGNSVPLNTTLYLKSQEGNLVKQGEAVVDRVGNAFVTLEQSKVGSVGTYYVGTPQHLLRKQVSVPVPLVLGDNPVVEFGTVLAGDIYPVSSDSLLKDNIINGFDVSLMYSKWGGLNTPADLNGDGTVNNRDLLIIYTNFGLKGEFP